jgi:hypothetical protein
MRIADQIVALDIACEIELYGPDHWEKSKRKSWEVKLRWARKGTELKVEEIGKNLELTMQDALNRMLSIAGEGLPGKRFALERAVEAKAIENQS